MNEKTTMTKDEALKLALEALENPLAPTKRLKAITVIKEVLAQPPEEHNFCPRCGKRRRGKNDWDVHTCSPPQPEIECPDCKPQRKPLTRERLLEIADAQCGAQRTFEDWVELFGRCIEAAHGIEEN